jgi:hypothetical protein
MGYMHDQLYTLKPLVVSAFRLGVDELPNWFLELIDEQHVIRYDESYYRVINQTQVLDLYAGNWLVRDSAGALSIESAESFAVRYNPVPVERLRLRGVRNW